ncbi:MAG TPA: hypothetical protein VH333_26750 [Pseudonocardiaceae bacterium]|jgi:hypothetical protein|nr:hypothetical protein [Pseudonocardiaceae bacterium]
MKHVDTVAVAELLAKLAELEHGAKTGVDEAERLAGPDPAAVLRQRTFSEGEVSGLVLAQRTVRDLAGWPVEADSGRE